MYDYVNHDRKQLYVGSVHSEQRLSEGGATVRIRDSDHPAKELAKREGTVRTIRDVMVDKDWQKKAQSDGAELSSARNNIVRSVENARLEELKAKYPDYEVLNRVAPANSEKALRTSERFGVSTKNAKTSVFLGDSWVSPQRLPNSVLKRIREAGRGGALAVASGIALAAVVGEATGANQEMVDSVGHALREYQSNPNPVTSMGLAIEISRACPGMVDSQTTALGLKFWERSER